MYRCYKFIILEIEIHKNNIIIHDTPVLNTK